MELKNPKVIVNAPMHEIGRGMLGMAEIGISHIEVGKFMPKQNTRTGLCSYQAKLTCKISRRMFKQLNRLLRPKREPKYVGKATFVSWIMQYDVTNIKTESELLKMTHRELEKMVVLIAPQILSGEAERIRRMYEPRHDFPCGGIVPKRQIRLDVNTGDAVIKLEEAKKMAEQLID